MEELNNGRKYFNFSYLKQYPDSKVKEDMEFENVYESDSQRELNQIFSAQSHIVDSVKFLSIKLDEVTGDQKKSLNLLSNIQSSIAVIGKISGDGGSSNGNLLKFILIYNK